MPRINPRWQVYKRSPIPVHRIWMALRALRDRGTELLGMPFPTTLYLAEGETLWWSWDKAQIEGLGYRLYERIADPAWRRVHFALLRKLSEEAIGAADALKAKDLTVLSDEEIAREYEAFYESIVDAHALLNPEIDAVDIVPSQLLHEKLVEALPKAPASVISELTAPLYISYLSEEEIALLRVKMLAKKEQEEALRKVAKKYWWTALGWESTRVKRLEDFRADISAITTDPAKRIACLSSTPERLAERRKELAAEYRLPDSLLEELATFDELTALHDLRKIVQVRSLYGFFQLLSEVARRGDYDVTLLEWFTNDEVVAHLRGKRFDLAEARRRKKALAVYVHDEGIDILSGDKAKALKARELDLPDLEVHEVHGHCASPGKVKGVARVCNGGADALAKVKEGDILICCMTLPDYVPAMKRAAAIVTDEGGITCHAAIISRELHKPCVTGTHEATDVFSDGEMVEVDAEHGTVRKI